MPAHEVRPIYLAERNPRGASSEDRLGRLSGLRFEGLCLYRPALLVGGKLKHPSLHCLAKECLSLTSTRFSARPVSLPGRDKDSFVHWQFAFPDPLIAPQAPDETLPGSHCVSGCRASNVIAVSLMTEAEQTIAVTLHRDIGTTLP